MPCSHIPIRSATFAPGPRRCSILDKAGSAMSTPTAVENGRADAGSPAPSGQDERRRSVGSGDAPWYRLHPGWIFSGAENAHKSDAAATVGHRASTLSAAQIRIKPLEHVFANRSVPSISMPPNRIQPLSLVVYVRSAGEHRRLVCWSGEGDGRRNSSASLPYLRWSGWLPMEQPGRRSGQTVAPKLYVAVGISGAIQHLGLA